MPTTQVHCLPKMKCQFPLSGKKKQHGTSQGPVTLKLVSHQLNIFRNVPIIIIISIDSFNKI
jgi:hypothetical protein